MPLANTGRGTGLGMGIEGTWNVAAARTDWMEVVSESLARAPSRPFRPHLVGGGSYVQQDVYDAGDDAGGDIEFEAVYNAICLGHVLYAAFGGAASTGPVTTEYEHTFTLGTTLPSFSIESLRGSGALDSAEVFRGMKCSKLELAIAARDVMRVRSSWIGGTTDGRTTKGTPTYTSAARPILHSQAPATGLTWNGTNFAKVTSFGLTLDNALERRPYLGSALTSEPDFAGWRNVSIRVGLHWDTDAAWTGFVAGTSSDATFNIAGTGDDDLDVTLQNALVGSVSDPISSAGVVSQTVVFNGRAGAANQGLSLVLRNNIAGGSYGW